MKLILNGLDVDCIIGDLPAERMRAQRLRVDVTLTIEEAAALTDELADTVDYAALADRIRRTLADAQCRMIERAAKVVADVCLAEPKVKSATVTVTKFGAIAGLVSAAAEYAAVRE